MQVQVYIRISDIDLNLHVGNIVYLGWILETMPFDIMKDYRINSVKIKYQKEITYGNKVIVRTQANNMEDTINGKHEIINENDEVVALLETNWIKI